MIGDCKQNKNDQKHKNKNNQNKIMSAKQVTILLN